MYVFDMCDGCLSLPLCLSPSLSQSLSLSLSLYPPHMYSLSPALLAPPRVFVYICMSWSLPYCLPCVSRLMNQDDRCSYAGCACVSSFVSRSVGFPMQDICWADGTNHAF